MTQPIEPRIWEMGVTAWLQHIENGYVERLLLLALDVNNGDATATIQWLKDHNYGSIIGSFNFSTTMGISVDVGGFLSNTDFMRISWKTFKDKDMEMNISLEDILNYLKHSKKLDVQIPIKSNQPPE